MRLLPVAILRTPFTPAFINAPIVTKCGHCALNAAGVDCRDVTKRRVKQRHALYRQGDACQAIFAVCSGTLKSTLATEEGVERVIGFRVPGDLLGLDGSVDGRHATTTIALEDTVVCSVAPDRLSALSGVAAMGYELLRMQQLLVLVGSANADVRLAQFLLHNALQSSSRGFSATDFVLRMSRADIGSYLGLSLETVSRSFSALQRLHLLAVDRRAVRIVNLIGLTHLAQSTLSRKWKVHPSTAAISYADAYQIRTKPVMSAVIKT